MHSFIAVVPFKDSRMKCLKKALALTTHPLHCSHAANERALMEQAAWCSVTQSLNTCAVAFTCAQSNSIELVFLATPSPSVIFDTQWRALSTPPAFCTSLHLHPLSRELHPRFRGGSNAHLNPPSRIRFSIALVACTSLPCMYHIPPPACNRQQRPSLTAKPRQ